MFHILYGWMAGFILSLKVFLGQKLYKLSKKIFISKKYLLSTSAHENLYIYTREHVI